MERGGGGGGGTHHRIWLVLQRIPQRFEETVSEVGVGDAAASVKEAFAVEVDILESGSAVGVRLMHRELGRFVHFREHASVPVFF